MRKIFFLCILGTVFLFNCLLYGEIDWQGYKTNHFIIYYHNQIPSDYINQVATKAEEYYLSIATNLGFVRYESWLWDNRPKIYIFKDAQQYQQEAHQRSWSDGSVSVRRKIIKTYPWSEGFFEKLLPHELGHIMFREFVGFKGNVPLWLDEGVAILQEKSDIKNYSIAMKELLKRAMPIPIKKLHKITSKTLIVPEVFYAQSASIVDYLLREFKKDYFIQFCKYLKDGRNLEEALVSAYHFKDLEELSKKWLEYLKSLPENN